MQIKSQDPLSDKTHETLHAGPSVPTLDLTSFLQGQSFRTPKTNMEKVLASVAGEEFFLIKCAIDPFPLKFREPQAEAGYRKCVALALKSRMVITGSMALLSTMCISVSIGISLLQRILILPSTGLLVFFWSGQAITLLACLTIAASPLIPRCRPFLETILNISFSMASLALFLSFGRISLGIRNSPNVVSALSLKLFSDTCIFGLIAYTLLMFSCVFQTRTRYTIFINTGMALVGAIIYIAEAVSILYVKPIKYPTNGQLYEEHSVGPFIIPITVVQACIAISLSMFATGSRYFNEMHERVIFYRWIKSVERVAQLQARSKVKANGTTAVEDIIQYIDTSIQLVTLSGLVETKPVLDVALKILRSSMQKLTKADQLFAISVKRRHTRARTRGDEDEMEERFYSIYANVTQGSSLEFTKEQPASVHPLPAMAPPNRGSRRNTHHRRQSLITNPVHVTMEPRVQRQASDAAALLNEISIQLDNTILHQLESRIGCDWSLNIPMLGETTSHILLHVGMSLLLKTTIFVEDANIMTLARFLAVIQALYLPNPYHNALHGAMVAHSCMVIANILRILTNNDFEPPYGRLTVTLIIAAVCHDVGHPGRNNVFFRNSMDPIALLYNDKAILENYHSCITFEVLAREDTCVLASLPAQEARKMRQRIIELILATDMGSHFDSISKFRIRRKSTEFDYLGDVEDFWLVLRMCIKVADLSHAMVDWYQHVDWSLKVVEEFYQQGKHEADLLLPVSPLCDRSTHGDFAKSQKGFIEFVVQPLVKEIEELDAGDDFSFECVRSMLYNKFKWEEMSSLGQTLPIPESIRSSTTMTLSPAKMLRNEVFKSTHNVQNRFAVGRLPSNILSGGTDAFKETGDTSVLHKDSSAPDDTTAEQEDTVQRTMTAKPDTVEQHDAAQEQEAYVKPPERIEDEISGSVDEQPLTFSSDEDKLDAPHTGMSFGVNGHIGLSKRRTSFETSASSSAHLHPASSEGVALQATSVGTAQQSSAVESHDDTQQPELDDFNTVEPQPIDPTVSASSGNLLQPTSQAPDPATLYPSDADIDPPPGLDYRSLTTRQFASLLESPVVDMGSNVFL